MSPLQTQRNYAIAGLVVLSAVTLAVIPFFGMHMITLADLMPGGDEVLQQIFWQIRLPRVFTSFIAGAALAVSGMVFQALFRNPLATPYTLGVSTGASLGAALFILSGVSFTVLGYRGIGIASFLGALVAVSFVYTLSRLNRRFSAASLLLAGVAVNFFFSSLILLVQYFSDFHDSFRILRWLMGGLEVFGYRPVFELAPVVAVASVIILAMTHDLNQLASGEELARARGVNINLVKNTLFIATSVMVGAVVSVCGPIGFVGMMAPHICRLLIGGDHRFLGPASMLFGGVFLTLCDAVARTVFAPAELPVGIITAFLGGPFFLWLLIRTPRRGL
jgi:iron complex transport system permease protein